MAAEDAAMVVFISATIHFYNKVKGPELTGEPVSAVVQFQAGASHVTASAAAEGQRNVEGGKCVLHRTGKESGIGCYSSCASQALFLDMSFVTNIG